MVAAPRAPAGFADGVLARFATTEAAIAVEKRRRLRRATWMIGGAVVALAAVLAIVLAWPRGSGSGAIAADAPRNVEIGDVRVELAAHASIEWRRDGDRLHVEQRGTATWHVPEGHQLTVVADSATIEATNSTLRVEIQMNAESKKLGATVAAISAVTVAVLAGKATLSSGGKDQAVEAGKSSVASPGKAPVELLTADSAPLAIAVVYASREAFERGNRLDELGLALERLQLPERSRLDVVTYSKGGAIVLPRRAGDRTGEQMSLVDEGRRFERTATDLLIGVSAGINQVNAVNARRRLVVLVGDGSETAGWKYLPVELARAKDAHIEVVSLIVRTPAPGTKRTLDEHGVPAIDATQVPLASALSELISPRPAQAVMVVYAGRGGWATPARLHGLAEMMTLLDLPADSQIAAIEYSTGASVKIPWEAATAFRPAQLGDMRDYTNKIGSDLVQGIIMGLAELSKQTAPTKTLIIVGDGNDTNNDSARVAISQLAQPSKHLGVTYRVMLVRAEDSPPGDVVSPLDPDRATGSGDDAARMRAMEQKLNAAGRP